MKTKDVMTYAFMALMLASFLSIAQILTEMRDQDKAMAKLFKCAAQPAAFDCNESVNLSRGATDDSKTLTVNY